MHTPIAGRTFLPRPGSPSADRELDLVPFLLLFSLLLAGSAGRAGAQASFPGVPDDPSINARVYPTDFWGPRVGYGVGLGLVGHNLARPNDQWLLTAAPARYEQVATASFASANPYRAARFVGVDGRVLHTDRDWTGPPDQRLTLRRSSVRSRVRLGQTAFGGHLLMMPQLTLESHAVDEVQVPSPLPPSLSSVSRSIPDASTSLTGLRVGGSLQLDARPRQRRVSGLRLRAEWDRYVPLRGPSVRFDQVDLSARAVLFLRDAHRLVVYTAMTVTRARTEVPAPSFMLPSLGGSRAPGWVRGRFVDRDRLLGTVLYRFPIWALGGVLLLEGHVGGHLGNVYRRLGTQFRPRIRTDEPPSSESGRPLRPTASVGLRVDTALRPNASVDLALGVGPEGVTAVQFSLSRPLRAPRPPHHTADNLR